MRPREHEARTVSTRKFWITRPISPTCEVRAEQDICGRPTAKAYPATGEGWMALCQRHGATHPEATLIEELLSKGEVLARYQLQPEGE